MQQRQAIQILENKPKPQVSEIYTSPDNVYLYDIEDLITAIDYKPVRGKTFRLYTQILKVFHLSATVSIKVLHWFSKLGSSEIEGKAMEASHNSYLSLRIRGMGL